MPGGAASRTRRSPSRSSRAHRFLEPGHAVGPRTSRPWPGPACACRRRWRRRRASTPSPIAARANATRCRRERLASDLHLHCTRSPGRPNRSSSLGELRVGLRLVKPPLPYTGPRRGSARPRRRARSEQLGREIPQGDVDRGDRRSRRCRAAPGCAPRAPSRSKSSRGAIASVPITTPASVSRTTCAAAGAA